MQRSFALFLCIVAQGAAAQCVSPTAATSEHGGTPAAQVQPAAYAAHAAPGLIKTASAGTRDDPPPAPRVSPRSAGGQDHPRRGGTAMLLAALALMSGIALRRYGARDT